MAPSPLDLHSWPRWTLNKGDRIFHLGVEQEVVTWDAHRGTITVREPGGGLRTFLSPTGPYASCMGHRAHPTCDECAETYTADSAEAFRRRGARWIGPCCLGFDDVYPDGYPHPDTYSVLPEEEIG